MRVRYLRRTVLYLIVIIVIFAISFPLFWLAIESFKPNTELLLVPPTILPLKPTLENFVRVIEETDFLLWFRNSLICASFGTIIAVVLSALCGYALARYKSKAFSTLSSGILFAYMVPPIMLIIPMYLIMASLELINDLLSVVIAYATFFTIFGTYLMEEFFETIPPEIEEAAKTDGAGTMVQFYKIALPLALPGIIAVALFSFINCWNEYLFAATFINVQALRLLPPALFIFRSGKVVMWDLLLTSSTLSIVPQILVFMLVEKYFMKGFGAMALKG
jgi:ABC-type glycerol-3-phosphate transport system permease component